MPDTSSKMAAETHISPPFKAFGDQSSALELSPLLRAALLTIDYIEAHGPIGLTPNKALKRYFVEWAAGAFQWPHYTSADLYAFNKVLNEQDFPPLVVFHDLLISTKLARHYKGALHLTKLGKSLKARPGDLWRLLTQHMLFVLDHAHYARFDDRLMGNWDIFLNVINVEAQHGVSEQHLCVVLFGGEEQDYRRHQFRIAATLYLHVLRPLCWAGLMEEHRIGTGLEQTEIFVKTPLWTAALALDTDVHLEPVTHH